MPLALCNTAVGSDGRELLQHGTAAFPIACYFDDLTKEEVPWHWHEELEAAVIVEGSVIVAAGNQKFTVRPGEGFFVNSGILHGCWNADGGICRFHSMVFHPRLVGGSLDSVFYQNYVQPLAENHSLEGMHLKPGIPWQAEALTAMEAAWQDCVTEPSGYEFRVRNELSRMIFALQDNVPTARNQHSRKALRDEERLKRMLQYIHEHCSEELTTRSIAQSAAISESECLRCFRAVIGTSPIQYVRQYRIQRAAELLTLTQERISDIASQCGFQDFSYFTKTFREMKGCTPSVYRAGQDSSFPEP